VISDLLCPDEDLYCLSIDGIRFGRVNEVVYNTRSHFSLIQIIIFIFING